MNFMAVTVEGDSLKLPFGDVRAPQSLRERLGRGAEGRQLIAGLRPESFEDASLVGDARDRGTTFQAHIEVLESMGSELYVHFTVESEAVQSKELEELAADAGGGEVPSSEEGRIVARLEPASKVQQGKDSELWVDADRVHVFDPESGASLTSDVPDSDGAARLQEGREQEEAQAEQPANEAPS
jgi:multiple sugar transport system ATP-binding protein